MDRISQRSIYITQEARNRLIGVCKEALPAEACGILTCNLAKHINSANKPVVDGIRAIVNNHPNARRSFSFDPADWTAAFFEAQKNRQQIVGFFHSHPSANAAPSLQDELGFVSGDETFSYWIVSFEKGNSPSIQPYVRVRDSFYPLSLVLA
ncbi:Mov34/MPN/PAD-1 family protein [Paenibacillus sp. NEAU-GSW1]|uniref:Mov34/MPN/PAD-1 family protein n=1 Tax=Paenibacillus sp. NEAU-GSW1 TaxID=2682486 RepID=UPI0015678C0D|nr:M67 family metallopeptidase [Paenibacillus sp. NEAU-GSW1]